MNQGLFKSVLLEFNTEDGKSNTCGHDFSKPPAGNTNVL